ncbi:hypothetical protein KGF56_003711 [Candida oxycetoniae]|uniref:Thioredoxin domain-containing protein n=1 Tax=Candida oxycetoniae TaxID=497107 RepID=A0AAI9WWQ3_9ASCO|nr:uncharacterized protein KGF56_003711 [Candida oxycetoniae]KAI3403427.2 hypothetical protein KGF56_003711 [Candida oxycetoniae]
MRLSHLIGTVLLVTGAVAINEKTSQESAALTSSSKQLQNREDVSMGQEQDDVSQNPEIKLPASLSTEEFDKITRERLVIVEFYSPYCHHCKVFSPKWEEAYVELKTKHDDWNIEMRQVNCVENGDLCERENIEFYPNILLYAPALDFEKKPTGRSKNVGSFPRTLEKNTENVLKYLKESLAEYDSGDINLPTSSKALNMDDMLKAISGEIEKPLFVSFWQSNEKQWTSVDMGGKLRFGSNCADCLHTKQIWDRLSNKILTVADSGHVLCQDNPELCSQLELSSFKNMKTSLSKFIMFLPKNKGAIRFDYDGVIDIDKMRWWVHKLYENSVYEVASAKRVTEVMEYTKSLPHTPIIQSYPLKSKVTVLFFYDANTVTPEDEAILPYLLKMLQKSPFNIQLYKAKHTKIEENIQAMGENLIDYINYDENDKYEYKKGMELATTHTGKPTLFVFKDNSLIPEIFQSFAAEDMRKHEKIETFLNKAQYPLYGELTPELVSTYFSTNDPVSLKDAKVVIIFVDLTNAKQTDEQLYKLSLIAHEYNFLKKQHYFEKILEQRQQKEDKVKELKEHDADTDSILMEMRREVPHIWNNDDVFFTFIDVSQKPRRFKYVKGWKINPQDYRVGEAVVLSRDNRYFWNTDLQGDKLQNDPKQLKSVLMSLLHKDGKTHFKLVGSPYGGVFHFMDYVHDWGLFGYFVLLSAIYCVVVTALSVQRVFKRRKYRHQGIIGVNNGNNNYSFLPKKD